MATKSLMQVAAEDIARQNDVVPLTQEYDETKSAASRTNDIVAADSPLMQQAATRGTQVAASRGLTNSSLAAQASQEAVIGAAAPLATTDANLSNQTSLANLAAKNQAALANQSAGVTLGNTALQLDNSNTQQDKTLTQQQKQFDVQAGQSQQQINNQVAQFAQSLGMTVEDLKIKRDALTADQQKTLATLENQRTIAGLQSTTQLKVAEIENQFKNDIANQGNITNAWGTMMNTISTIQNNPNLDANTKTVLINNQLESFRSYADFWKQTGTVDVGPLLNFGAPAPAPGAAPAPSPGYQPVPQPTPAPAPGVPDPNLYQPAPNPYPGWHESPGGS